MELIDPGMVSGLKGEFSYSIAGPPGTLKFKRFQAYWRLLRRQPILDSEPKEFIEKLLPVAEGLRASLKGQSNLTYQVIGAVPERAPATPEEYIYVVYRVSWQESHENVYVVEMIRVLTLRKSDGRIYVYQHWEMRDWIDICGAVFARYTESAKSRD